MGTFRISSSLKHSIASFLLCASILTTVIFIYPVILAIYSTTVAPALYTTIASISAIVALSSAIYLSKSTPYTINNKKQKVIYNAIEERLNDNNASTQTLVVTTISPSLPTLDLKESTATNIPTSPLPSTATLLQSSQLASPLTLSPSPLLSQSANAPPPPPPLPPSKKPLSSTVLKNFPITKLKSHNKSFQEELKEKLQKIKEKITKVSRHEIL
ncbi:hypothetical protein [Wolbachia endosymbiont of Dirofilaria (Dirofilaria) immitis]|uniref:hypothetical protein n=1 Tax=Wolbachia endosymbiont of Dirofilaria (Dirofilaria) immitis TaxID=1812115 RepID=UPI00158E4694|nr:hypothetical protein [Wolbachia endosymbiont of Dirofilaria (Dirofilaria) immitis]QKX02453.1 hypothetical protein GOY12_02710 [Wolbachia endosymbiont of Dirofilaria (Dirofilaria) immitis]